MGENPFAYDDFDQAELPVLQSEKEKEAKKIETPQVSPQPAPIAKETQKPAKPLSGDKMSKLEQLKAREAELLRRQSEIKNQTAEALLAPNWPSQYPIIRYDLENDLTPSARPTVKFAFYGLLSVVGACIFNILAILSVTGLKDYSKPSALIFGIIQGIATLYVVINFSYTGIYEACKKKDVSFKWIIIQFCFIAWCGYRTIGFPSSGSVGIAVLLDLLANDSNGFSRFIALLNSVISGAALYFELKTLMEAQKYQKISGKNEDEDKLSPPEQI